MSKNKHANGGKTNGGARASQADYEAFDRFLDELERDPSSVSGFGRSQEERRMIAERLVDYAMDCPDPMLAMGFALRAVRLDPAVLDARVLLAIAAGGPQDEFIEELQAIIAAGEADMGQDFFRENRGHFWGIVETRPYMRARCRLAQELYLAGRIAEAIAHYEEMMQLNPNDNQGLRYPLLGHYLETDSLDGARRLFAEFDGEPTAMFLWGRVLERYLAGDLEGAAQALRVARTQNAGVEEFITGRKRMPKSRPDYFRPGDITEALTCMDTIGAAWTKHREAVQWLKKEHGSGHLFTKDREPQRASTRMSAHRKTDRNRIN
jgi:tetratricopeptide (TPR) repeat protein